MEVGERIRQRRLELNMTQEELAELLDYSGRSSINKIENGVNDVPAKKILSFAKVLKCTPAWLMGFETEKEVKPNVDYILPNKVGGSLFTIEFDGLTASPSAEKWPTYYEGFMLLPEDYRLDFLKMCLTSELLYSAKNKIGK